MRCLLLRLRDCVATAPRRAHARRGLGCSATLTCHFLSSELSALDVCPLTVRMVQLGGECLLVGTVRLATLLKPSAITATLAAITLAAITAPADIEQGTAARSPANLLAELARQDAPVFLKAELDNGRRSWQAVVAGGSNCFGAAVLNPNRPQQRLGFFLLPPEDK